MGAGDDISSFESRGSFDSAGITRDFPRTRRGYDPAAVDQHLALITTQVKQLLERQANGPDESLELVLKATRRSVDEALQDARGRADAIIAEAQLRAAEIETDAQARCRALDAEGRERYLEMGRLADSRAAAIEELDRTLARHQDALRAAAADLEDLAADLTDVSAPRNIAAMGDDGLEIVLPARPAEDR